MQDVNFLIRTAVFRLTLAMFLVAAVTAIPFPPGAQAAEKAAGPVTNLPLPRFVSLKTDKANIRRGPGLTYRIDWVFLRKGMPLQILAEHGHWRKVRDMDDATGWVHHALLRGARTAVVTSDRAALRDTPAHDAELTAIAEAGVVVSVTACAQDWCEVQANGHQGWAQKAELWGVAPSDEFD